MQEVDRIGPGADARQRVVEPGRQLDRASRVPGNERGIGEALAGRHDDPDRGTCLLALEIIIAASRIEPLPEHEEGDAAQRRDPGALPRPERHQREEHAERELVEAADNGPVRPDVDLAEVQPQRGAQNDGADDRAEQRGGRDPACEQQQKRQQQVEVQFDCDRPGALRPRRQNQSRHQRVQGHRRAAEPLGAERSQTERNDQQRREPQHPVEPEWRDMELPAADDLREQEAAQRHEQGDAGMALVEESEGKWGRSGFLVEVGTRQMLEVPDEDEIRSEATDVVELGEINAFARSHGRTLGRRVRGASRRRAETMAHSCKGPV